MIYFALYSIIFLFFSWLHSKRKHSAINSFFVFSVFAFLYYFAIPIEILITEDPLFPKEPDIVMPMPVTNEQLHLILMMGCMAIFGFGLGHYLTGFNSKRTENDNENPSERANGMLFLLFGSALILFSLYWRQLLEISSYQANMNLKANLPLFNLLMYIFCLSAAIYLAYIILKEKISFFIALLFSFGIIMIGLYSNDKDPVLLGVLPLLLYLRKFKLFSNIFIQYLSILLLFVSIPFILYMFSVYRGSGTLSIDTIESKEGLYKTTDARGAMWVNTTFIKDDYKDFRYGGTYLKTAVLWIPRYIFPNRPDGLDQEYAKMHRKNLKPGEGLSYSLLAEAYINFGFFGGFIQYFLIGITWGFIWKYFRYAFFKSNTTLFESIYVVFGFYILTIMHRGATNQILTTFIQTMTPIVFLSVLLDRYRITYKIWTGKQVKAQS